MKNMIFFVLAQCLFVSPALAAGKCLFVELGGVSSRLESITVPVPPVAGEGMDQKLVRIETFARKDDGVDIVTPFECIRHEGRIVCVQPEGAGDFFLREENKEIFFETEYLNLALGATAGLPPRKDEDEINEDFAIFFEEPEDRGSHPNQVSLKTKSVECPKAPAASKK